MKETAGCGLLTYCGVRTRAAQRRARAGVITLLFAVAVAAGCATTPGVRAEGATLVVDNQSASHMTIYAFRGAERVRLGQVTGLQRREMRIPPTLVNGVQLRFQADPLGSNIAPISHEVTVWAGDTVTMVIPPVIR